MAFSFFPLKSLCLCLHMYMLVWVPVCTCCLMKRENRTKPWSVLPGTSRFLLCDNGSSLRGGKVRMGEAALFLRNRAVGILGRTGLC